MTSSGMTDEEEIKCQIMKEEPPQQCESLYYFEKAFIIFTYRSIAKFEFK
jgi:hypothetical protein